MNKICLVNHKTFSDMAWSGVKEKYSKGWRKHLVLALGGFTLIVGSVSLFWVAVIVIN